MAVKMAEYFGGSVGTIVCDIELKELCHEFTETR